MRPTILLLAAWLAACSAPPQFDTIIAGGTVYDGLGGPGIRADVGIAGDSVAAVGDLSDRSARERVDAAGLAVAPGFVNMLSWADESLIQDPRGLSDLVQGVTLEVFGEGSSMGPLNPRMIQDLVASQNRIRYDVSWTTLGGYLSFLEERGVSPNVASFVGAGTIREYVLGDETREPTGDELARMRDLVRAAMEEGAVGVGSSLIYTPGLYASTAELVALAAVAAEYDGLYISHIRNESDLLEEAVEEHLRITREAGIRSEIYHLKAAGRDNWQRLERVIARIEEARAEGLEVGADIYTYTAGATGLDAAMPPWVREGGFGAWRDRLQDPALRARAARDMRSAPDGWENLYRAAGAEGTLLVGFRQDSLRHLIGRTLADVALERGVSPEEAAMDLVVADSSRVSTIYFLMSEENVARKIATPWVTFGSDAAALAPEEPFTLSSAHPRAYGNFARLLGRYVREEGLIPLGEAVHRLTDLPSRNLRIARRGRLAPGYFADVVIFDPETVADRATYEEPHRLSMGVRDVWVNGVATVRDGAHTGATAGRFARRATPRKP
jgi:N-acyl-D-amino-acid deacylase